MSTDQHDEVDDPSQVYVNPYGEGEWERACPRTPSSLSTALNIKGTRRLAESRIKGREEMLWGDVRKK